MTGKGNLKERFIDGLPGRRERGYHGLSVELEDLRSTSSRFRELAFALRAVDHGFHRLQQTVVAPLIHIQVSESDAAATVEWRRD